MKTYSNQEAKIVVGTTKAVFYFLKIMNESKMHVKCKIALL